MSNAHELRIRSPGDIILPQTSDCTYYMTSPFNNDPTSLSSVYSSPFRSPTSPLIPNSPFRPSYWETTTDSYEVAAEDAQHANDDEYDYDIPYWVPSNEKTELLIQISKLKIKVVPNENIK